MVAIRKTTLWFSAVYKSILLLYCIYYYHISTDTSTVLLLRFRVQYKHNLFYILYIIAEPKEDSVVENAV